MSRQLSAVSYHLSTGLGVTLSNVEGSVLSAKSAES
jgi:hypothetical protein